MYVCILQWIYQYTGGLKVSEIFENDTDLLNRICGLQKCTNPLKIRIGVGIDVKSGLIFRTRVDRWTTWSCSANLCKYVQRGECGKSVFGKIKKKLLVRLRSGEKLRWKFSACVSRFQFSPSNYLLGITWQHHPCHPLPFFIPTL